MLYLSYTLGKEEKPGLELKIFCLKHDWILYGWLQRTLCWCGSQTAGPEQESMSPACHTIQMVLPLSCNRYLCPEATYPLESRLSLGRIASSTG